MIAHSEIGLKISKNKHKKKHKKSSDNQAEYYYPLKTGGEDDQDQRKVKNGYSLRKRNKGLKKKYKEPSENEFDSEEELEEEVQVLLSNCNIYLGKEKTKPS